MCHPGPPAGRPSIPASVTGALAGSTPGVRDTRQPPPLQLAVGEDVDLTARAGDAHDPGQRGCGRGRAREAGQPGAAPGAHQHGEAAGVTAARPGQAGDSSAATGSNPGDARGAGAAAMPGSPLSAATAWAPRFIWGRPGPGRTPVVRVHRGAPGRMRWPRGWSGPGQLQSRAGAREQGQDAADGRFLAGGFGQQEVSLELVAVAAAIFLLRHVAGSVRSVTMSWALRSVLPGPAASRGAARPGRGRCTAATGRGRSGHSNSPP